MITFNGKNSKTDFDLYIASREQPPAQRKVITETVPYMSGLWDFSYHDGDQDEYEPVKIKYTFDVIADSKQELKALRGDLIAWIHSKGENKLIDKDISETAYYIVYHAQASWAEEGLQGLLTAEFTCYPFLITANKEIQISLQSGIEHISLNNEGSRIVTPTITVESKNIVDLSTVELGKYFAGLVGSPLTFNSSTSYAKYAVCYIPVSANTDYVFSLDNTNYRVARIAEIDKNSNCVKNTLLSTDNAEHTWRTADTTTRAVILLMNKNSVDATTEGLAAAKLQIERGTAATTYTEYGASATVQYGSISYVLGAGEYSGLIVLKQGNNIIKVSGTGIVIISYGEEAL